MKLLSGQNSQIVLRRGPLGAGADRARRALPGMLGQRQERLDPFAASEGYWI
jgi:hypothetical protein